MSTTEFRRNHPHRRSSRTSPLVGITDYPNKNDHAIRRGRFLFHLAEDYEFVRCRFPYLAQTDFERESFGVFRRQLSNTRKQGRG
ncbi:hypothetical protein KOR42_14020 [Thalassoglobus neptunius]|uniref:Uncharacterized protein n=1 Tax=Thalassoglobus neptunius TaxID=1938619 RepID=A0A5C5X6Z7_9PLAN|nr:hypothetical protein KOR42_14020 [Thalassoglobus neptunius]